MCYTLSENGDNTEKLYWPLLKDTWPNYEVLWQEIVVPLTGRPYDIKLRQGTAPLLDEMCMAHYSIFYSPPVHKPAAKDRLSMRS